MDVVKNQIIFLERLRSFDHFDALRKELVADVEGLSQTWRLIKRIRCFDSEDKGESPPLNCDLTYWDGAYMGYVEQEALTRYIQEAEVHLGRIEYCLKNLSTPLSTKNSNDKRTLLGACWNQSQIEYWVNAMISQIRNRHSVNLDTDEAEELQVLENLLSDVKKQAAFFKGLNVASIFMDDTIDDLRKEVLIEQKKRALTGYIISFVVGFFSSYIASLLGGFFGSS